MAAGRFTCEDQWGLKREDAVDGFFRKWVLTWFCSTEKVSLANWNKKVTNLLRRPKSIARPLYIVARMPSSRCQLYTEKVKYQGGCGNGKKCSYARLKYENKSTRTYSSHLPHAVLVECVKQQCVTPTNVIATKGWTARIHFIIHLQSLVPQFSGGMCTRLWRASSTPTFHDYVNKVFCERLKRDHWAVYVDFFCKHCWMHQRAKITNNQETIRTLWNLPLSDNCSSPLSFWWFCHLLDRPIANTL